MSSFSSLPVVLVVVIFLTLLLVCLMDLRTRGHWAAGAYNATGPPAEQPPARDIPPQALPPPSKEQQPDPLPAGVELVTQRRSQARGLDEAASSLEIRVVEEDDVRLGSQAITRRSVQTAQYF